MHAHLRTPRRLAFSLPCLPLDPVARQTRYSKSSRCVDPCCLGSCSLLDALPRLRFACTPDIRYGRRSQAWDWLLPALIVTKLWAGAH